MFGVLYFGSPTFTSNWNWKIGMKFETCGITSVDNESLGLDLLENHTPTATKFQEIPEAQGGATGPITASSTTSISKTTSLFPTSNSTTTPLSTDSNISSNFTCILQTPWVYSACYSLFTGTVITHLLVLYLYIWFLLILWHIQVRSSWWQWKLWKKAWRWKIRGKKYPNFLLPLAAMPLSFTFLWLYY